MTDRTPDLNMRLNTRYREEGWGVITDQALNIPPVDVESQARRVAEWAHDEIERLRTELAAEKQAHHYTSLAAHAEAQEVNRLNADSELLRSQLAAVQDRLEYTQKSVDEWRDVALASQARESVMRDILGKVEYVQPSHLAGKINKALDIPHDNSALSARLAQERERFVALLGGFPISNETLIRIRAAIRALGDET